MGPVFEWFCVSRYGDVTSRAFSGETTHTLQELPRFGSRRFTKKVTKYATWYPTRDQAETAAAVITGDLAAAAKRRAIRDAGPFLLEALTDVLDAVGALTNVTEFPNVLGIPEERGAEILAKLKALK